MTWNSHRIQTQQSSWICVICMFWYLFSTYLHFYFLISNATCSVWVVILVCGSVLCVCGGSEREASKLRLLKKQVCNLARGTRVSETSGCLAQFFTEHQECTSFIPENKHKHKMNKHKQHNEQDTNVICWTPQQQYLDSLSDTVLPNKDVRTIEATTPLSICLG